MESMENLTDNIGIETPEEPLVPIEDRFDLAQIIRRDDGSYVVNKGSYHIPNNENWFDLWSEIDQYASVHPDLVIKDEPFVHPKEVLEAAQKAEAVSILNAYMRTTVLQTGTFSPAEFGVLAAAHMFDSWQAGASYSAGQRIEHNGVVYEVMQAVTAQSHQPPDAAGMLAVYRPLSVDAETGAEPDGSRDNPYAYTYGMDVYTGKYYTYDEKLWLAKSDMRPCTWNPGTAGLWQWEEVVG